MTHPAGQSEQKSSAPLQCRAEIINVLMNMQNPFYNSMTISNYGIHPIVD